MLLPKKVWGAFYLSSHKGLAIFGDLGHFKIYSFSWKKNQQKEKEIEKFLQKNFLKKKKIKVVACGWAGEIPSLKWRGQLWLKKDILSLTFKGVYTRQNLPQLLKRVCQSFDKNSVYQIKFFPQRVPQEPLLVSLEQIKETVSQPHFEQLKKLSQEFQKNDLSLAFFNSTPRGGGVALMRHAYLRLGQLLGLKVSWHVLQPEEEIFEITKKKFHDILQNIAAPFTRLTDSEKHHFLNWSQQNARYFQPTFKQAKIIVIDDPQPSGLIPYIKKENPEAKIIFRSHIHLYSSLINKKGTPQNEVWNFLWKNIKMADLFIFHPCREFIPQNVPAEKTLLLGASTDPLDGLNKDLSSSQEKYYLNIFNQILRENDFSPLDLKRPYFTQIARFDPSKGILDCLEAYRLFREKTTLKNRKKIPQLVITGNGAIDDPESSFVYQKVLQKINSPRFKKWKNDIKVARLPHCDQILNAVLRNAIFALQLSYREGFEVKVTEALLKGKPVIAYNTGGIALQIADQENGFLLPRGKTNLVAEKIRFFLENKEAFSRFQKKASLLAKEDCLAARGFAAWIFLANQLAAGKNDFSAFKSKDIFKILEKI